jgi:simple sugar transport system ATP-binding protein
MDFKKPVHALKAGIGMLYQEPMDFPQLTVLENILIGRVTGILPNKKKFLSDFLRNSSELGFSFDMSSPVSSLTLGERQQLEIVRLITLGVDILILDEPTTGISDTQKTALFSALKSLACQGSSVILVSHKLEDVVSLCDEATVLRQGSVSGRYTIPFDRNSILQHMFPEGNEPVATSEKKLGEVFLSLDNISSKDARITLTPLSLNIRRHEIIGLAGLEGSGQELFLRTVAGVVPLDSGAVSLDKVDLSNRPFRFYQKKGIFYVPGSRMEEGLISGLSLTDHEALKHSGSHLAYGKKMAEKKAAESIEKFIIKAKPSSIVDALSGGNQQRFLLSLLPDKPRLLLLENPTRGLDHD